MRVFSSESHPERFQSEEMYFEHQKEGQLSTTLIVCEMSTKKKEANEHQISHM